ncbi:MAG: response regulator [Lachnospiraceae bacterium]|nr:response regulator [Lachnospiraceae bacterium]
MIKINHYNILLVDDEALLRQSIKRMISNFDEAFYVEAEAADGEEALNIIKERDIHIVIADINMPVMDGLTLCKKIREHYSDIVTVLLTGFAEFSYAQDAIRYEVFDYLLKPVSEDDLSTTLYKIKLKLDEKYKLPESDIDTYRDGKENVDYAVNYIQTHYMEDIDFGALSSSMGFTSAYLTKLFSKYIGEPPLKFLTGIRMHKAKRLLLETSLPIREVGEKVGYPDQFHFSKTFRKNTGMNPSSFRSQGMSEEPSPSEDES